MALASTDPKVLMGQAKCFACLSPSEQNQTYLLAKIAGLDTSKTGVNSLAAASACFSCLTIFQLKRIKQYLLATWLGVDTSLAGIQALVAAAKCVPCLTPAEQQTVQVYLLAVMAGQATDSAGVAAIARAAACFDCLTTKQEFEVQVYLLTGLTNPLSSAPSDLAAAARCFISCLPYELSETVQTNLITQSAGRSTPPCVTPSHPFLVQVAQKGVTDTNTQLSVRWQQLANTGTLITGYVVYWGTTSGGPYTNNSGVLPITPKNYIISGLTAGTTYYVVVQAVTSIAGCVSTNSSEANGTTTGAAPCVSAIVTDWLARIAAGAGTAPSAADQLAVCQFANGLVTDGIDGLMLQWNPIAASGDLIASLTPALLGPGTRNIWTNSGPFVAGDLTAAGLKGNGTSKFSATGFTPTSWSSDNSCGITIYLTTNPNSNSCDIGSTQGGNLTSLQPFGGTTFFDSYALGGRISAANAGFKGFISGNRVAGPTTSIYEANSTTPFNTLVTANVAPSGNRPGLECYAWAMNNGGAASSFSDHTIGFIAFHNGLSAAQAQLFYNRIQTLMTALGRAI